MAMPTLLALKFVCATNTDGEAERNTNTDLEAGSDPCHVLCEQYIIPKKNEIMWCMPFRWIMQTPHSTPNLERFFGGANIVTNAQTYRMMSNGHYYPMRGLDIVRHSRCLPNPEKHQR